jgi:uncharacterized protein (UPF0548 family)
MVHGTGYAAHHPHTSRNEREKPKMKRDPHSKFTFAITEFKLQATWNDGVVEDLTRSLPESLLAEIEQYLTDMDDLRTQDPESY